MLKNLFSRKNWFTIANWALTLVTIVLIAIAFRPLQRAQSVMPPDDDREAVRASKSSRKRGWKG